MKRIKKKKDEGKSFIEFMKVDEHRIDKDSLLLPNLFAQAVEDEASFWSDWEDLKTRRATMKSKVQLELRGMSIKQINNRFGTKLSKVTEASYEHLVRLDPRIKLLADKINKAFSYAKHATAQKEALREKRNSLDRLTTLHGQGYFQKKKRR